MEPIQRDGAWWHKHPDGSWLRFDVSSGQWQPAMAPPPPPPPPPPVVATPAKGRMAREVHLPEMSRPVMMGIAGGLVLVLLAVAAFFFLGSDDPEPTDPGVPVAATEESAPPAEDLSKRDAFVQEAEAICADIVGQLEGLPQPTTAVEIITVLESAREILMSARDRGLALEPPAKLRKGWRRLIGTEQAIADFDAVIDAMKSGDFDAFKKWEKKNAKAAFRDALWAERHGLMTCAQTSG